MFSDFDNKKKLSTEGRRRIGVSLAASVLIYVGIATGLAAAVATARAVIIKEKEVEIEFAKLPDEPKPEPVKKEEKPKVEQEQAGNDKPKANRDELLAPDEIPEGFEQADGELADAGQTGPIEGVVDGILGGPKQEKERVARPKFTSGCRGPEIPDELREKAETVRVLVNMLVTSEGKPAKVELEKGHSLIPDQEVLQCAQAQRFKPATLADGTPVAYPIRRQFTFRPSNI